MIRRLGLRAKMVIGLLVVALVPLVVAVILVDQIGAAAGRVAAGEAARLRELLERAAETTRELVVARKDAARLASELAATRPDVRAGCQDAAAAGAAARGLLAAEAGLARVALVRGGGELAGEVRPGSSGDDDLRVYTLEVPVAGEAGCALRVTWSSPGEVLAAQERLGEALLEHRYLDRVGRTLPRSYWIAFVALFGGVVAIVTVLAIVLARGFTGRIRRLAEVTRAVGAGDLTARAGLRGDGELADLGRAFDGMVGELAASRSEIEYLQKIAAWQEVARRLAHEIKNPLTPIQLAVQQLAKSYRGDDARFAKQLADSHEIVTEEVAGLRRLVDAFSGFAKLPTVEATPLELGALVDDVVRDQTGLTVEVDAPSSPVVILADRLLLRRALTNLLDNAREAGATRARLAWRAPAAGQGVTVTVDDDGPGVRADVAARIFDPYVTTKEHGTGLGLAIVKKTLLEHGGDVTVDGARGPLGGARFQLRLAGPGSQG